MYAPRKAATVVRILTLDFEDPTSLFERSRMLYQGDLQSGIAKAVQETKSVVCFVTDESEESLQWEQWLNDQNIPTALESKAVALKLPKDSQEATYFTAFCPVPSVPFLAVIHQGQVEEQLASGVTKNEFTIKLLRAINRSMQSPKSQASAQTGTASTRTAASASAPSPTPASTPRDTTSPATAEPARSPQRPAQPPPAEPSNINNLPRNRTVHQEDRERKRQRDSEIQRIRQQIENGKRERRERRLQQNPGAERDANARTASPTTANQPSRSVSDRTRIQVRQLDGSAISSSFPTSKPFSDVRGWIDDTRTDGGQPYNLMLTMTPLPSRGMSDSDDSQTLAELGLHPSASLRMTAVRGIASAYQSTAAGMRQSVVSAMQAIFGNVWAHMPSFFARVWSMGRTFLGLNMRGPAPSQVPMQSARNAAESRASASGASTSSAGGSSINIRTLRDQAQRPADKGKGKEKADSEHQLYNGGGLNFEPRERDE